MTKLRFPSLGGGHKDGEQASGVSARNKDQRHTSPFRSSRNSKESGGLNNKSSKTSSTSATSAIAAEGPQRSKTPGKVRWLVNASSDLVKSATTLKKTVHKQQQQQARPSQEGRNNSFKDHSDDGESLPFLDKNNDDAENRSSYLPTLGSPPRPSRYACDPEETLSVSSSSTAARSNRTKNNKSLLRSSRPPPLLMETVELNLSAAVSSSSSPQHEKRDPKYSFTPPDPEGLELWTTPTKSTSASSSFGDNEDEDDDSSTLGSNSSSDNSGLVLFGDQEEEEEEGTTEKDMNTSHREGESVHGDMDSVAEKEEEEDTPVLEDDTKTEATFQTAAATVASTTAEEAAWGACADLTAAADDVVQEEDAVDDVDEEVAARQALEETLKIDVSMDADIGQDEEEYDDYTYTPSLAPSAGFDTISPSFFGFDGSTIGGGVRNGNRREGSNTTFEERRAASPPKEVLAMKAARAVDKNRSIPEEESDDNGDTDDMATNEEEIRLARDMANNLLQELEKVRGENERIVSRSRRLQTHLQEVKIYQEEHLIQRSRLVKACMYISPIFILCGGLDIFCITILLVWVLVEVESYMDLGDEKAAMKMESEVDIFDDDGDKE